jgi:hypothetical protein
MIRLNGWELRLLAAVDDARDTPFQWGQHDCATWAFDVRLMLTGDDAAAVWRGKYKTEAGAARVLRKLKCQTVDDLAESILGDALPTVLLAQRGDIVLGGAEQALGVCVGSDGLFLQPSGLIALPLRSCLRAWRV